MINHKTIQFIRDFNSLYKQYSINEMQGYADSIVQIKRIKTCPCCGNTIDRYRGKEHSLADFPYFTEEMAPLFLQLGPHEEDRIQLIDIFRENDMFKTHNSYVRAINANHNRAKYSYSSFLNYRRMIRKFAESPFFSEELLNKIYEDNGYQKTFPDELLFQTFYCTDCYDDAFISFNFVPHKPKMGFSEQQKRQILQDLAMETKMLFYTLTASSFAYIYCFSYDGIDRHCRKFEEWMTEPYKFTMLQDFLRPMNSL